MLIPAANDLSRSLAAALLLTAHTIHAYAPAPLAAYSQPITARYSSAIFPAGPARPFKNRLRFLTYDEAGDVLRAGPLDADGQGRAAFAPGDFNLHVERRWNAVELVGYAPTNASVVAHGQPAERDGERFRFVFPLADPSPASTTNLLVCAVVPLPDNTEQYCEQPVLLRLPAMPEELGGAATGATTSDSLAEYRFDARGRLRRVTDKAASVPRYDSAYDYYPDGRRARKTVSVFTNDTWQLTRTHQYLYDRWNLIQETISNPQSEISNRLYTWGLDLAGLYDGTWDQQAGGIGGLLAITEVTGASTNIFLPVCDQVGTVHALVAAVTNGVALATPVVAARYEYSPYGELLEVVPDSRLITDHGSLITSPTIGFQSKYRDEETGFWYFGHRFLDPRAAQWLNHDPLREGGGFNLAAFCGGDPVNQVDPLGLETLSWTAPGGQRGEFVSNDGWQTWALAYLHTPPSSPPPSLQPYEPPILTAGSLGPLVPEPHPGYLMADTRGRDRMHQQATCGIYPPGSMNAELAVQTQWRMAAAMANPAAALCVGVGADGYTLLLDRNASGNEKTLAGANLLLTAGVAGLRYGLSDAASSGWGGHLRHEAPSATPRLRYRPTSGAVLEGVRGRTTTLLGSHQTDLKHVIRELDVPKTYDPGPKPGGFNVLNVPNHLYQDRTQFWVQYNRPWLDAAISRRDNFIYVTRPEWRFLARPNASGRLELSGFGKEYLHMRLNGYPSEW